jgi:hypothetical protein
MGYGQWVSVTVTTNNFTVSIKNATLSWGKFYATDNKDVEISVDAINSIVIAPGNSATINSCGRENTWSGTEGSFDIYDGQTLVGNYSWNCPHGSSTNTSTWKPSSDAYIAQLTGGSLDSGPLGNVNLKATKF